MIARLTKIRTKMKLSTQPPDVVRSQEYIQSDKVRQIGRADGLEKLLNGGATVLYIENQTSQTVVEGCPDSVMFALNNGSFHKGCPCLLAGFNEFPDYCPYLLEQLVASEKTNERTTREGQ